MFIHTLSFSFKSIYKHIKIYVFILERPVNNMSVYYPRVFLNCLNFTTSSFFLQHKLLYA